MTDELTKIDEDEGKIEETKIKPKTFLSPRELREYHKWKKAHPKSVDPDHVSEIVGMQMYELFLNGYSCAEIERVYTGRAEAYPLGKIVEARVLYNWDEARIEHRKDLYNGIKEKTQQTHLESATFIADILGVAHKEFGAEMKLYRATGDVKYLNTFRIKSPNGYQQWLDMFLKATAPNAPPKDTQKKQTQSVNIITQNAEITTGQGPAKTPPQLEGPNAQQLLEMLGDGDDE